MDAQDWRVTTQNFCTNEKTSVQALPPVMYWCAGDCNPQSVVTLTLENGHYVSCNPLGVVISVLTVQKFTPESVVMHRRDYGQYPGIAILTGQLSSDGNSIINGIIRWTHHDCCGLASYPFHATWGKAVQLAAAGLGPCNDHGNPPANSERALAIAKRAALNRDDAPAFVCFLLAAQQGNASAQVDVAYAYEKGVGTHADLKEAHRWYLAAAQQGNTFAQFVATQWYKNGIGGVADQGESDRWTKIMWDLRNLHSKVCGTAIMKTTLEHVEWLSVKDNGGALLGAVVGALTGMNPYMQNAQPVLVEAQGSDILQQYGNFHIDLGMASGDSLAANVSNVDFTSEWISPVSGNLVHQRQAPMSWHSPLIRRRLFHVIHNQHLDHGLLGL
jgi:hypothetical protein